MTATPYLYRTDLLSSLAGLTDTHFRARRWNANDPYSFPHHKLQQLHLTLPPDHALYRICFYTTFARAQQSLPSPALRQPPRIITRVSQRHLAAAGFNQSDDDGFKPGDAYLYWRQERATNNNQEFSAAGISINHIEAHLSGNWQLLRPR